MGAAYGLQRVLFTVYALNGLFSIALYLLAFSSPLFLPSLIQVDGEISLKQPGTPAVFSQIWTIPWSAGAKEMASQVNSTIDYTQTCKGSY